MGTWGWKFQPSTHMVGPYDSQSSSSKSHIISISSGMVERGLLWIAKRCSSHPLSLRKFQGFKSSIVLSANNQRWRPNIYIFLLYHSVSVLNMKTGTGQVVPVKPRSSPWDCMYSLQSTRIISVSFYLCVPQSKLYSWLNIKLFINKN